MEHFNRRNVMFAVLGAAGLALTVDKVFLSGGLAGPSPASAATPEPGQSSSTQRPGNPSAQTENASVSSRLDEWKANSSVAIRVAEKDPNAFSRPAWSRTVSVQGDSSPAPKHDGFVLTTVLQSMNTIRLRHDSAAPGKHNGLLKLGQPEIWSERYPVKILVREIFPDHANIEIDGVPQVVKFAEPERVRGPR